MDIVVNKCFGGFSLSDEAVRLYAKKKGIVLYEEEGSFQITDFYTVPVEEYKKVEQACKDNKDWAEAHKLRFCHRDIERNDPLLVEVVRELGDKANDRHSKLRIVEIPDDVDWELDEYDGMESVHEKHRSW